MNNDLLNYLKYRNHCKHDLFIKEKESKDNNHVDEINWIANTKTKTNMYIDLIVEKTKIKMEKK